MSTSIQSNQYPITGTSIFTRKQREWPQVRDVGIESSPHVHAYPSLQPGQNIAWSPDSCGWLVELVRVCVSAIASKSDEHWKLTLHLFEKK